MHFFKPKQPILQRKKLSFSSEELRLARCLRIKTLEKFSLCGFYTCVDQAMLIWGVLTGIIFISAQFLPLSWIDQAIFWSIITLIGVVAMTLLTYSWTIFQGIPWLLYIWSFLMLFGVIITDYAIAFGWSFMLMHLCELWLVIGAIGYTISGLMLRSRAFFFVSNYSYSDHFYFVMGCSMAILNNWFGDDEQFVSFLRGTMGYILT